MQPDFSKKTIDTLAKRAAFLCSNPDCRKITVGPNSDAEKSTLIGEAAHIFGARVTSKRFCSAMTDVARAEITNAIWLCRNCHKKIDSDEQRYTSNVLFSWRELHEKYTHHELGSSTDRINYDEQQSELEAFSTFPSIVKRITIDKPDGWEYRLTAELMRFLNQPVFRKLDDLRERLYIKNQTYIEDDQVFDWIKARLAEQSNLTAPIERLIKKLNESWGAPGEPGDMHEILHVTQLIRDYLETIVAHEEQLVFVNVSEEYESLVNLLKDNIGFQAKKLQEIPKYLDEVIVISLEGADHGGAVEQPLVIKKTIVFDLPDKWEKKFNRELQKAFMGTAGALESNGTIWLALFIFVGILMWLVF